MKNIHKIALIIVLSAGSMFTQESRSTGYPILNTAEKAFYAIYQESRSAGCPILNAAEQKLFDAIYYDDVKAVTKLLRGQWSNLCGKSIDLNAEYNFPRSIIFTCYGRLVYTRARPIGLLRFAVKEDSIDCLEALIAAGADPKSDTQRSSSGLTLLHYARSKEAVQSLIKLGLDVNDNKNDKGQTPLHRAISDVDVLKALCEARAGLEIKNNFGSTALRFAARSDREEAFKVLFDAGAENSCGSDQNCQRMYAKFKEALRKENLTPEEAAEEAAEEEKEAAEKAKEKLLQKFFSW